MVAEVRGRLSRESALEFAPRSGLLPQITPVNGLAKQGFFATGNWFYRIGVFCEILHRKMLDPNNIL
jgi:hypothetical protein